MIEGMNELLATSLQPGLEELRAHLTELLGGPPATGRVVALTEEKGDLEWDTQFSSRILSGLTGHEGSLIFTTRDSLFRLDGMSGEVMAAAELPGTVADPPTVWNTLILVGSRDGFVAAYDLETLELAWRLDTEQPIYGSIAVARNTYETVKLSGELVSLMRDSQQLLNALFNRQVPALRTFENLEMKREFEKLTAQLRDAT